MPPSQQCPARPVSVSSSELIQWLKARTAFAPRRIAGVAMAECWPCPQGGQADTMAACREAGAEQLRLVVQTHGMPLAFRFQPGDGGASANSPNPAYACHVSVALPPLEIDSRSPTGPGGIVLCVRENGGARAITAYCRNVVKAALCADNPSRPAAQTL